MRLHKSSESTLLLLLSAWYCRDTTQNTKMTSKVDNTAYVEQDYSFLPIFVFEICLNNVVSVTSDSFTIFSSYIFFCYCEITSLVLRACYKDLRFNLSLIKEAIIY